MRQFPMFDLGTDTEGLGRTEEEVVFDPEEEKINSISKSIHEFGHYKYFNGYLYYSSKYSPSEVTTEALINDNFYTITDIQNNLLVKYQVY